MSEDPSADETFRYAASVRVSLFGNMDTHLRENTYRFLFILADSGMGKSSFLLNYYARHERQLFRRRAYRLHLLPLGEPGVDGMIGKIEDRTDAVLLLDALDEDHAAIKDYRKRLSELIELTKGFRTVVITCRTQFFSKDDEIPVETGMLKHGPVKAGESRVHRFHRLYLAPFSDAQVDAYLSRRYTILQHGKKKSAKEIVKTIPDLAARPMLLAHVEDLAKSGRKIEYGFQVYEEMLNAWLDREDHFVPKAKLREFSEKLAVEIFLYRGGSGLRVPGAELKELAGHFEIALEDWQLRGRSLLNRDEGNYKFAHRSILEYLVATQLVEPGRVEKCEEPLSDVMARFVVDMIAHSNPDLSQRTPKIDLLQFVDRNRREGDGLVAAVNWLDQRADASAAAILNTFFREAVSFGLADTSNMVPVEDLSRANYISILWIDKFLVTNRDFECMIPGHRALRDKYSDQDNQPVIYVNWHEASLFCRWRGTGFRLPTEDEWYKAASWDPEAGRNRKYPWGDEFDPARCNTREGGPAKTTAVDTYPNGRSAYGCFDMAGNVWEWTSSRPDAETEWVRGGSWFSIQDGAACASRFCDHPHNRGYNAGLRCART